MKKMLTVMAGIVAAGSFMCNVAMADTNAAALSRTKLNHITYASKTAEADKTLEDGITQLPNTFEEAKSLKEAEKIAGINMSIPSKIKGYENVSYQVIKEDKFIQVYYEKGENDYIIIRKAVSKEDISGDYNKYENTKKLTVKGYKVTLKGNGKTYTLATWKKGKYAYSVGIYNDGAGMSLKQVKNIINKVK